MSKELYAYLAGIIDGEGYIGIKKSTYGLRKRPDVKSPTYSERVQIKMSNPAVLKIFKKTFGGSLCRDARIYQSKSGYKTNSVMWCYQATDRIAINIIKAVFPYLIEKKREAEILLKLRESKESQEAKKRGGPKQKRVMNKEILQYREQLYQLIKKIHKKD